MKENAQRIAIAEWMGWQWYRIPHHHIPGDRGPLRCLFLPAIHDECQPPEWLVRADGTERICNTVYLWREGMVPDYTKDLNAIHNAELKLERPGNGEQVELNRYAECLLRISLAAGNHYTFQATAAQRAEALLRTLNLWKDE